LVTRIPVAVRHTCREDHEAAGSGVKRLPVHLDRHGPGEDVEDLVDLVGVQPLRRPAARWRTDIGDADRACAVSTREELLREALVRRERGELRGIQLSQVGKVDCHPSLPDDSRGWSQGTLAPAGNGTSKTLRRNAVSV